MQYAPVPFSLPEVLDTVLGLLLSPSGSDVAVPGPHLSAGGGEWLSLSSELVGTAGQGAGDDTGDTIMMMMPE